MRGVVPDGTDVHHVGVCWMEFVVFLIISFREHIVYHAEVERRYMPVVLPLLTGNVIFPRFLSWDVDRKRKEFAEEREKFANNVDGQITELLHTTAWPNNTLGTS